MKRTYFLSDAHLGSKTFKNPLDYERRLVRFLESIREDAKAIYLLGDIIDFWYEYKTVVPRGFTRFLGKLGELTDQGIEIHWFAGNHDIWMFDYLPRETGVILHHRPLVTEIDGKKLFLAHGDGLGDDSASYKLMSSVFRNRFCQRLFSAIHPRWSVSFAHKWSQHSRLNGSDFDVFLGEDREHLVQFAKNYRSAHPIDYFIFGHRHIMLDLMLSRDSRILILGDWVTHFSYAVLEEGEIWLEQFEEETAKRDDEATGISIAF